MLQWMLRSVENIMKIYLVGGAVRDKLLGYPVKERDWVVVGATPEILLQQGFEQVGKDFPVFLHPKTHEEYALARTERKQAPGYYGFTCDFNPHVTLEDLAGGLLAAGGESSPYFDGFVTGRSLIERRL